MATYTLVNATYAQKADVNAGGTDVDAKTYKNGVTMTDSELAAFCSTQGCYATSDLAGVGDAEQIKRDLSIASQYLSA